MAVNINVEWKSSHEVTPPADMDEETFTQLLDNRNDEAWGHALDQVDSSTAELMNWEVVL